MFVAMEVAVVDFLSKLAAWHQLHVQLRDARLRLKEAPPGSAFDRSELEQEVSRLQEESDSRLEAINQSLGPTSRSVGNSPPAG